MSALLHDQIRAHLGVGPLRFHELLERVPATAFELADALAALDDEGRIAFTDSAGWALATTATAPTFLDYALSAARTVLEAPAGPPPAPESAGAPAVHTEHVGAAGNGGSLWHTRAGESLHGLPASKVPGLEDEIRVLTLDDVSEPPEPEPATMQDLLAAEVSIREAINRSQAAVMDHVRELFDRIRTVEGDVDAIKHPEPVGPVAAPLGIHVEALAAERRIVAWLRGSGIETRAWIADSIERGEHLTKEGA